MIMNIIPNSGFDPFTQVLSLLCRLVLVLAIALQAYWFFAPRNRANPMSDQTIEAFRAEGNHPNAETKAALDAQLSRDAEHNGRQHLMAGIAWLVLDGIGIYFVWNFERRTSRP
jgi:hypothetical protein